MQILKFKVDGQYITRLDSLVPVANCVDLYHAQFEFVGTEWNGTKTAVFEQGGKRKLMILDPQNECVVPWEFFATERTTYGSVSVFCGNLVTANVASVKIQQSGYSGNDTSIPPTPDVYQQLLDKISGMTGASPEEVAKAVQDYLAKNPIAETDPTVPQWAKEPKKPTYTANEVGALPNSTHIPTQLSEMTEDATHRVVTDAEKQAWNNKSDFSGSYNDLTNKPTIPSKLSEMAGDVNNRTVTDAEKNVWNAKAEKSDIPDVANFATKAELGNKADKTEIANLATKAELQDKANQSELNLVKENLNGFVAKDQGIVNQGKVLEVGADGNVVPKDKQQIPTKLPNPQKLTFQGAVTAEYDGSGAVTVTIPSGASGGSVEVERIEKLATDTNVELEPNKLYIFPEMASLTYTLKAPTKNTVANEYHFVFKSGASATQLVHAVGVNVGTFKVESNKIYEISIMENLLTSQSWAVV